VAANIIESAECGALFDDLSGLIEGSRTIALCAHTNPDGDAIGSVLGLAGIIEAKWPGKQVTCLLADPDPVPRSYRFLPGSDAYVNAKDFDATSDLFICVDLPSADDRLEDALPVARRAARLAVIDHHPTDDVSGDVRITRPDAAAAGVVVAEFGMHLGLELTFDIAQCLMCAIVTDTGRFQYQNTDGESLKIASLLVDAGANPADISLHVYQSYRIEYLHLEAQVMSRIKTVAHGRVAYSYATLADIEGAGCVPAECEGLIDVVRTVDGSEVALFVKEVAPGKCRGNLRAKGGQDVSAVARQLGGGGHVAAAGFTCEGDIHDIVSRALALLEQALESPQAAEG
jgi:phosphoesterase RecJ-like protein